MATKERLIIESMFMIADKEGNDVPFILNSAQAQLDATFTGRDIIPKARQEGISSYYIARGLAKCLAYRNINAVIVSHDDASTKKMLKKAHYMVDHIRGPKPVVKNSSAYQITFPKMGSSLSIGTAGSSNVGVGDTIHFLHCSEVALWTNPKALLKGLFQAVPKSGEIGMESTGRGQGNYYHRAVMRSASGQSRYRMHFFDWQSFPEYSYDLTAEEEKAFLSTLNVDWDELEVMDKFGLTVGQLAWRRDKIEELDFDLTAFKQEYPMTLDECFQATGRSIFTKVNYQPSDKWQKVEANFYVMEGHPQPGKTYALGADVGGGVGQDNSTMEIVDLDNYEQVGEYVNNRIGPDTFGEKIVTIGKMFNEAYLSIENNNHGIVTIKEVLRSDYPKILIHRRPKGKSVSREEVDKLTDYGFRTSVKSKPFIIGELRRLARKDLIIHSPQLMDEMNSFIEDENGKLGADVGCYDDTVMGMGMCIAGIEKACLHLKREVQFKSTLENDPFSLASIQNELRGRNVVSIFKNQAATENDIEDINVI